MTVGDLFSGIGGFTLAAEMAGLRTQWFSEIDDYASRVLQKVWPDIPNLGDICSISNPTKVDILVGGFPCQDISVAGKGAGIEGERSGLWGEFARLIGEIRPKYVVAENVTALRRRGLDRVLADLCALGYDAEWHCIPARAIGADHQRDRIWIIAYPQGERVEGLWPEGFEVPQSLDRTLLSVRDSDGQWKVEPDIRRADDGISNRAHRLRCLGNAIVPQMAFCIFDRLVKVAEQPINLDAGVI